MADVLIIDDEEALAYSMTLALKRAGHTCRLAHSLAAGTEECNRQAPDLLIVDVQLPDGDGVEFLARLRERGLESPAIVITAHASVERAVDAMKSGAADYLSKPVAMDELRLVVDRCLENRRMRQELSAFREAAQRESEQFQIIGESPTLRALLALAERIARTPDDGAVAAVLILGETGVGKELLARYMHRVGPRREGPFVQVNCTAIPESLFESELFGHERGAFSDARTAKKGLFEIADGGTLLLDEIGDLPMALQPKLLVAIETGRFRRVGGVTERSVSVRVAAATNSDLECKVREGRFRADLFHRLQGFRLNVPPLRERGDDVLLMAEYFVGQIARRHHRPAPALSAATRQALRGYSWPGNVRELSSALRRAIVAHDPELIEPEMLGLDFYAAAIDAQDASPEQDLNLAAIERRALVAALERAEGNVSEAARLLGISRGGLRHRMARHGLDETH